MDTTMETPLSRITIAESDYNLPSYNKPGRILVQCDEYDFDEPLIYNWIYDVLDYDADSSVYWINDGVGFDRWLDNCEFPAPGTYVVENIRGHYTRGSWGYDDDDEDWNFSGPRLATEQEIADQCLQNKFGTSVAISE